MKISQVAAQLYTVREFTKTAVELQATLKKIRAIGYEAVQVSGVGPIDPVELRTLIEMEGLVCCATHEGNILAEPQKVAEKLATLRCKYTAYPYPGGIQFDTIENVRAFAKRLNDAGRILADAGVTLTYHNHQIEFQKVAGRLALEVIYAETDPRYLQGEIDTYWVQFGGGDPAAWCEHLRKRLPLLHMKDYEINKENRPVFAEIGRGNLDWKRIVKAAERSGCQWFIVEQDVCQRDPFESLQISFDYIREHLCT